MTIKLESLVSELNLDPKGFTSGSKIALAATGALVAGIGTLTAAAGVAIKATFDWASEVDKLGDVMGGTNKQMAALAFVARKSGVGVDTLTKANVIMEKSLTNAWGGLDKVGISLYRYGINIKDINGKVKDQATLTSEISKKYQSLATQQERVNFLTEVYGKNGAELVDFFDTLAQDGGIDAVTKKVEAFGLAIDPSRYEQFNRNLEELKLIGTGLAVQFTEKVMPALEGVLSWLEDKAPKAADAFKSGGWKGLGNFIIGELGNLDTQVTDKLNGINWAKIGQTIGDKIDESLKGDGTVHLPKFVTALGKGLFEAFSNAALGDNINLGWKGTFSIMTAVMEADVKVWTKNLGITWSNGIRSMAMDLGSAIGDVLLPVLNSIYSTVVTWYNKVVNLLNKIPGINISTASLPNSSSSQLNQIPTSGNLTGSGASWNTSSGGGGTLNKRASGGSVIAGQTYAVSEFWKPEMFTPNQSGRIDQMKPMNIDENKIGDAMARRLLRDLPPMLQLLKA